MSEVDGISEIKLKKLLKFMLIQFFNVIGVAALSLIGITAFFRAGNQQHTGVSQDTLDFPHHFVMLIMMLDRFKADDEVNGGIR